MRAMESENTDNGKGVFGFPSLSSRRLFDSDLVRRASGTLRSDRSLGVRRGRPFERCVVRRLVFANIKRQEVLAVQAVPELSGDCLRASPTSFQFLCADPGTSEDVRSTFPRANDWGLAALAGRDLRSNRSGARIQKALDFSSRYEWYFVCERFPLISDP